MDADSGDSHHVLPAEADDVIDIVRFLAMDATEQHALLVSPGARPWVQNNPRPIGDLFSNFEPYAGAFDHYPGESASWNAAHDLLMELIVCARLVEVDDAPSEVGEFDKVEWRLLRRLSRLTLEAFGLPCVPLSRMHLFSY